MLITHMTHLRHTPCLTRARARGALVFTLGSLAAGLAIALPAAAQTAPPAPLGAPDASGAQAARPAPRQNPATADVPGGSARDGVILPPPVGGPAEVIAPPAQGTMPVIPPPGTPRGQADPVPK